MQSILKFFNHYYEKKFKTFHNLVTLNLLSTRFNEVCHMLATHYQNSDLFLGILMSRKSL